MNKLRIHKLLQYALAVASQNEDWDRRELGPIHLIKYVYLADLAYAEAHDGETYTGIPWRFHKFGPWNEVVFLEIDTALVPISAEKKQIPGHYDDDFFRWRNTDPELVERLQCDLNFLAALAIQSAVRKFGSDTEELLDFVYKTEPMLRAAPGEELDFKSLRKPRQTPDDEQDISRSLSQGQQKRRNKRVADLKEELKKRFQKKQKKIRRQERDSTQPPPRYDGVYHEGVAWLDSLVCEDIPEGSFTSSIHPDLWKSRARYDPDLSE